MIRVLFVPTLSAGVSYWRMMNFREAIKRNNYAESQILWWNKRLTESHPWQFDIADPIYQARIATELEAYVREADVIVFGSVQTLPALSTIYSIRDAFPDKVIVCETDDDVTDAPAYNPASTSYRPGSEVLALTLQQMRDSDAVIVSTPYLKEVYSEFSDTIHVAQNSIDSQYWAKAQKKNNGGISIGWIGGASHDEDLRLLLPVMDIVDKECPEAKWKIVHGVPQFMRGRKNVEAVDVWSRIDRYPKFLSSMGFTIGVAPLVDNKFNRAKSNLRWLEYSAVGVPTVASNVGHFAETIKTGHDGFLAEDADQFAGHILRLIKSKELRSTIAKNAKERMATDFNVDRVAFNYVRFLEELVAHGPKKKAPAIGGGVDWDSVIPLPELSAGQELPVEILTTENASSMTSPRLEKIQSEKKSESVPKKTNENGIHEYSLVPGAMLPDVLAESLDGPHDMEFTRNE